MIEIWFPSDTNQQLAYQWLEANGVAVTLGDPGYLEIDREVFVENLTRIEDALSDYGGRIMAD